MKCTPRNWRQSIACASAVATVAAGFVIAGPVAAQKTQLLVYTALETDQIKAYEDAFSKANPNIEIKWVRDSTGVITAKLLAEKANPQADLVVGVSASSLAVFSNEGMLQPYAEGPRQDLTAVPRSAKSTEWVGRMFTARRLLQHGRSRQTRPAQTETWKDLTKPVYKGKVVMPNPASSGTGYLTLPLAADVG
jgi:iron(III) transport system substrate-binding protein